MDHGFMPIVVRVVSQDDYDIVAQLAASRGQLAGLAMITLGRTRLDKEDLA